MLILRWATAIAVLAGLTGVSSLVAQAPAGATAKCKDGSYSTAKSHRGACKGHDGVDQWLTQETGEAKTKPSAKTAGTEETPPAKSTASTVTCKDGTTSKAGKGACSHHGGVGAATETGAAPTNAAAPANPPAAVPASPPPQTTAKSKTTAPAGAPADATALCKDGSYSHAQHHRGACSKHGGVDQWLKDVPK